MDAGDFLGNSLLLVIPLLCRYNSPSYFQREDVQSALKGASRFNFCNLNYNSTLPLLEYVFLERIFVINTTRAKGIHAAPREPREGDSRNLPAENNCRDKSDAGKTSGAEGKQVS